MAEIVICRHGNTFDPGETVTRVGGRTDLPLSKSGRAQAEALAANFAHAPIDRAYCSPLRRTTMTLHAVLAAQAAPPPVETRAFLTELDYGEDENRPEAEVVARIGQQALHLWESKAVLPSGWRLDIPGLVGAWRDFLAEQRALPGRTMVMTSNGVARFVFAALGENLAERAPDAPSIKLKTGAYGVLRPGADSYDVAAWNVRPDGTLG